MRGGMLVNAHDRFRARRRLRRRTRLALLAAAGVVAVVIGGWLVSRSSLFDLRTVTVEGTSRLSPAQVVAATGVRRGESLFRLDPEGVARRVSRLPAVASAAATRHWPHGLVVRVTERRPAAVVDTGGTAVLLDRTGVAFATDPKPPPGLVPVTVTGPVQVASHPATPGNAAARAAMIALGALPPRVRGEVTGVRAPSPLSVTIELKGERSVVWGAATSNARKAAVLRVLLRRPAHVYDVSTPQVAATR